MDETTPNRLTALLASPRVGLLAVGIGVVLNLPSVPTGWYLDDLLHRAQFLDVGPMTDSSDMTHRMYDFLSGDPEDIVTFKDLGVLPWWSEDELKIRFWRPLSSFTHVIDYALWPASGVLMHAHNVAWLAFNSRARQARVISRHVGLLGTSQLRSERLAKTRGWSKTSRRASAPSPQSPRSDRSRAY